MAVELFFNHITFHPIVLLVFQLTFFFILGLPISVAVAAKASKESRIAIFLAAPLFGLSAMVWLGLVAIRLDLWQEIMVLSALSMAILVCAGQMYGIYSRLTENKWAVIKFWRGVIFFTSLSLVFSIWINTVDLRAIGLNDYLPLTNGDTFAYFGHVDQLRSSARLSPVLEYPAGYSPYYQHALNLRSGVAALVAGQADLFNIDTHVAFFSTLRVMLPIAALGVFALLVALGSSWLGAGVGFGIFAIGNFMLHQILQQFLSSSVGVVCALNFLVFVALLPEFVDAKVAGYALGFSAGIYGLASPEAHLFEVFGFFAGVSSLWILSKQNISSIPPITLLWAFGLGFLLGVFPLFPDLYRDIAQQYLGGIGGHPGDGIAQLGYFTQASGLIPFFKGNQSVLLKGYSAGFLLAVGSFVVLLLTCGGAIWLVVNCRNNNRFGVHKTALFLVTVIIVFNIVCIAYFMVIGKGYAMLKAFDYHCFIPAVILGLLVQYYLKSPSGERACCLSRYHQFACVFLVAFVSIALLAKFHAFRRDYVDAIRQMSPMQSYSITHDPDTPIIDISAIRADLRGDPLNMFLYVNRWKYIPIVFDHATETARYYFVNDKVLKDIKVSHVFRMGYPKRKEHYFSDINRAQTDVVAVSSEIIPAIPYLRIAPSSRGGPEVGPGWLAPEGRSIKQRFRWLSREGRFTIYAPMNNSVLNLHALLARGPDLRDDNLVEILFGEQVVARISAIELPQSLTILVPSNLSGEISASFRISGPIEGVRQISVAGLYVDSQAALGVLSE